MTKTYRHRRYNWQGNDYLIRDVLEGGRFVRCEYATQKGKRYAWHPCPQGVEFSEIRPVSAF